MTAIPPTTQPAARSAAAERMRRHPRRPQDGLDIAAQPAFLREVDRMGRQHIKDGMLTVKQQKTGATH
jgi:hypothetical protein